MKIDYFLLKNLKIYYFYYKLIFFIFIINMDIIQLKQTIKNIENTINIHKKNIDILKKELNFNIKNLSNLCPHTNKIKKRESGQYGETYWYCPDCELTL